MKRGTAGSAGEQEKDPYAGVLFTLYRALVASAVNYRWVTLAIVFALFIASVIGFGSVKSGFFPDSNTPLFFVDVRERALHVHHSGKSPVASTEFHMRRRRTDLRTLSRVAYRMGRETRAVVGRLSTPKRQRLHPRHVAVSILAQQLQPQRLRPLAKPITSRW